MSSLIPADVVIERGLKALGSNRGIVIVRDGSQAEIRFANNTVTTNGVRRSRDVTVIAVVEREGGVAAGSSTRTGEVDIVALVAAAEAETSSAPLSTDAFAFVEAIIDADFDAPPALNDLEILDPVLGGLGASMEKAEGRGITLAGFAEHALETISVGSTSGLRRRHVQPTGSVQLVGRAEGGKRSSWVGIATPDFADVRLETMEENLYRRLEWATKSLELPAGKYETLLPSSAVADLTAYAVWMAGGQDSEDGGTVFSKAGGGTRMGEQLSTLPFSVRSNPFERGLEALPFVVARSSSAATSVFDNGLSLAPTSWIEKGVLTNLHYHRAGAARSGLRATPPIDNLIVEVPGATGTIDDMIKNTERALLVTCLWYIRVVDPTTLLVTGLTRDGVYLVENGSVVGQVNNFRFNESPIDMLARATEAGAPSRTLAREFGEYLNRAATSPLRVADFNMSSVSQAS